jgi:hypothetical protein
MKAFLVIPTSHEAWIRARLAWDGGFRSVNIHTSEFLLFTVSWMVYREPDNA